MFPLPYAALFNVTLYVLFALDVALLLGGLLFAPVKEARHGALSRRVCLALSSIVFVAAVLQWRAAGGASGYAGWILLGMALGLLGDLIMAELIPVPDRLIFGMLAFGAGHIVYILALTALILVPQLWGHGPEGFTAQQLIVWAIMLVLSVLLWHTLVRKPGGNRVQNIGALVYSLLMGTLNALAISLALQNAAFIPLALGAACFLASDLILGHWNIRGHAFYRVNDVIWVTYNLAQLLIVFHVAAAAKLISALHIPLT
jgi:hypothetical protein